MSHTGRLGSRVWKPGARTFSGVNRELAEELEPSLGSTGSHGRCKARVTPSPCHFCQPTVMATEAGQAGSAWGRRLLGLWQRQVNSSRKEWRGLCGHHYRAARTPGVRGGQLYSQGEDTQRRSEHAGRE